MFSTVYNYFKSDETLRQEKINQLKEAEKTTIYISRPIKFNKECPDHPGKDQIKSVMVELDVDMTHKENKEYIEYASTNYPNYDYEVRKNFIIVKLSELIKSIAENKEHKCDRCYSALNDSNFSLNIDHEFF